MARDCIDEDPNKMRTFMVRMASQALVDDRDSKVKVQSQMTKALSYFEKTLPADAGLAARVKKRYKDGKKEGWDDAGVDGNILLQAIGSYVAIDKRVKEKKISYVPANYPKLAVL